MLLFIYLFSNALKGFYSAKDVHLFSCNTMQKYCCCRHVYASTLRIESENAKTLFYSWDSLLLHLNLFYLYTVAKSGRIWWEKRKPHLSQVNICWRTSMSCSIIKDVTSRFTSLFVWVGVRKKYKDSECGLGLWWRKTLFTGYRWNECLKWRVWEVGCDALSTP